MVDEALYLSITMTVFVFIHITWTFNRDIDEQEESTRKASGKNRKQQPLLASRLTNCEFSRETPAIFKRELICSLQRISHTVSVMTTNTSNTARKTGTGLLCMVNITVITCCLVTSCTHFFYTYP